MCATIECAKSITKSRASHAHAAACKAQANSHDVFVALFTQDLWTPQRLLDALKKHPYGFRLAYLVLIQVPEKLATEADLLAYIEAMTPGQRRSLCTGVHYDPRLLRLRPRIMKGLRASDAAQLLAHRHHWTDEEKKVLRERSTS